MSGSIAAIPMSVQGINPWAGYEAYNKAQTSMLAPALAQAEIAQRGAQTGLLGAQAESAGMANQWTKMRLDQAHAAQAAAAGAAGGGGGGYDPNAAPGIGNSLPNVAPGGMIVDGMLMPGNMGVDYWQSADKAKVRTEWVATRANQIRQLAEDARRPDGSFDRQTWDRNVMTAYQGSLIDGPTAQRFLGHPEFGPQVIQTYVSPDLNAGVSGARAGSVANAEVEPHVQTATRSAGGAAAAVTPYKINDRWVVGEDGLYHQKPMSDADFLEQQRGGGAGTGKGLLQQGASANAPDPDQSDYSKRMTKWENPGGNPAQRNTSGPGGTPASTAMGNGQFTNETWLDQVKKSVPTFAAGKTDQQLLAARALPGLSAAMTDAKGDETFAKIQGQFKDGVVPAAAVALGHRFGAGGLQTLMNAPQDATLKQVLPDAAASNKDLANMTVRQLVGGAVEAFGWDPYKDQKARLAARGGPAPGQAAAPAATPAAAPAPGAPRPGQVGAGPPVLTAPQQSDLNVQQAGRESAQSANVKQVTEFQDKHNAQADAANQANAQIDQIRLSSQTWTSGKFADHKMAALAAFDDIRNNFNAVVGRDVLGKPSEAVGNWTDFNKNATGLVSKAVLAVSPRAAFGEFQMIAKGQPQDTTSPAALRQIFDQLQGVNDFAMAKAKAAADIDKVTGSPGKFEAEFNNKYSVEAFILHRASFDDAHRMADAMGKTAEGREYMKHVIDQMNELEQKGYFPDSRPIPTGKQR